MPTLSSPSSEPRPPERSSKPSSSGIHQLRQAAESFGVDAARYDHVRPPYPPELVERIVAGRSGLALLDVGCGTGIAARQFRAAGCAVLGLDPDDRMAGYAREHGLEVEVSTFEAWEPGGRRFDVVTAAQSWHWVDPAAGVPRAAEVLVPGGRLAVFGHVFEPPEDISAAFAEAFRRVVPDSPFHSRGRRALELYQTGYAKVADSLRACGAFERVEQWRFDWTRPYRRQEWLDLLPTTGGLTRLGPDELAEILDAVGAAVDARGGGFTMEYVTLAVTGVRRP